MADPFVVVGSYSADPSLSALDAVRFEIGDTGPTFEFGDAEITYALAQARGGVLFAAAALADTLGVRFGQRAQTESVGDVSVGWGDRATAMMKLADRLRRRAEQSAGAESGPVGLGLADTTASGDPYVWRGMHDHPGALGPDVD